VPFSDALVKWTASVGYSGYFPVAPGTAGTLVAACLYWIFRDIPPGKHLLIVLAALGLGIAVSERAETLFNECDCRKIVIDELVGFWVTMLYVPPTAMFVVSGFILFRIFDIAKPFPVNVAERRLRGGLGVMMDDVIAGLYANAGLHLLGWLIG